MKTFISRKKSEIFDKKNFLVKNFDLDVATNSYDFLAFSSYELAEHPGKKLSDTVRFSSN